MSTIAILPTEAEIEAAKEVLKNAGYMTGSLWQKDDIRTRFDDRKENDEELEKIELSDGDIDQIALRMENSHDANNGINWDVIDFHTDEHLKDMAEVNANEEE